MTTWALFECVFYKFAAPCGWLSDRSCGHFGSQPGSYQRNRRGSTHTCNTITIKTCHEIILTNYKYWQQNVTIECRQNHHINRLSKSPIVYIIIRERGWYRVSKKSGLTKRQKLIIEMLAAFNADDPITIQAISESQETKNRDVCGWRYRNKKLY